MARKRESIGAAPTVKSLEPERISSHHESETHLPSLLGSGLCDLCLGQL
jgi:hypothetical protein